jgi:hypothetical protein
MHCDDLRAEIGLWPAFGYRRSKVSFWSHTHLANETEHSLCNGRSSAERLFAHIWCPHPLFGDTRTGTNTLNKFHNLPNITGNCIFKSADGSCKIENCHWLFLLISQVICIHPVARFLYLLFNFLFSNQQRKKLFKFSTASETNSKITFQMIPIAHTSVPGETIFS